MGGFRDYHTLWRKPDKDGYHTIVLICGLLKKDRNELICKREIDPHAKKTNLWLAKAGGGIN